MFWVFLFNISIYCKELVCGWHVGASIILPFCWSDNRCCHISRTLSWWWLHSAILQAAADKADHIGGPGERWSWSSPQSGLDLVSYQLMMFTLTPSLVLVMGSENICCTVPIATMGLLLRIAGKASTLPVTNTIWCGVSHMYCVWFASVASLFYSATRWPGSTLTATL